MVPAARVLRVLALANEAREIGDRNAALSHALTGICGLVGADNSFLLVFDSPTASVPLSAFVHGYTADHAPALLARYVSHGDRFDLLAQQLRAAYDGQAPVFARCRQELIDDHSWYNSAYVNEFRRPWGFDHSIYSIQRLGQQRIGMSVSRGFGSTPFSPEDRALIEIFHLAVGKAMSMPAADSNRASSEACRAALPPRAREILDCLLRGAQNKDIAEQLRISPNTVHHYCKMVFRAFGVSSRGALIARWYRAG